MLQKKYFYINFFPMIDDFNAKTLLEWYIEAGVDETCGDVPLSFQKKAEEKAPPPLPLAPIAKATHIAIKNADTVCEGIKTLEDLRAAVENFEGCALKSHASKTVFGDGNPHAKIMFIGEAPGADEDRMGIPFVGKCGQLLNKMLEAINLNRKDCFISNILPWRPPGNRTPTEGEVAVCLHFIKKQIELVSPDIIVMLGGSAANALLDNSDSISRLRGKWLEYTTDSGKKIDVIATFHPAFLLRNSLQKAKSWYDFLRLAKKLYNN